MTQKYAAVIFCAVALAATVPAYGRQDPRADASRSVALRLRPDTLALFINNVAGLRVRLVSGVVGEISSPRVFTLKNERSAYPHRPSEVAIVVDTGSAVVREGAAVVVTGTARTLLGAELDRDRPLPSLTESERTVVAKLPLVMASSVQTPDGVQLVRPNP
jgi:hypothetical protein